jgi:hypothetical protein
MVGRVSERAAAAGRRFELLGKCAGADFPCLRLLLVNWPILSRLDNLKHCPHSWRPARRDRPYLGAGHSETSPSNLRTGLVENELMAGISDSGAKIIMLSPVGLNGDSTFCGTYSSGSSAVPLVTCP